MSEALLYGDFTDSFTAFYIRLEDLQKSDSVNDFKNTFPKIIPEAVLVKLVKVCRL